jgi:predicted ATPase
MTARPEFADGWASDALVTRLALEPFGDDDIRRLVSELGGDRALPEPVIERIVGSAAGIPLFAEEVGRTVLESGMLVAAGRRWELAAALTDLEIPQTLQGSLLARLDRIGPAKAIAQVAAVIGREFRFDLLAEVAGIDPPLLKEQLARLVDSALVFEEGMALDTTYVFRDILIQVIAY